MSKSKNPIEDFVFSLSDDQFQLLIDSVDKRKDKEMYGFTSLEEESFKYGRKPVCPHCGSRNYIVNGHTPSYHKKYRCLDCD